MYTIAILLSLSATPHEHEAAIDKALTSKELKNVRGKFRFDFEDAEVLDMVRPVSMITRLNIYVSPTTAKQRVSVEIENTQARDVLRKLFASLSKWALPVIKDGDLWFVDHEESGREYWCVGNTCPPERLVPRGPPPN